MGDFFALRAKKSQHHGHGKPLPPLLRFVCRAGCPHPAAGRRGRRPLQRQAANFPAMADARGGLWAGRPTHSPQKAVYPAGASGTPPPTAANRKHISVFFNNNRRPPWKTSPAGGSLLCVNRAYLLILSIAASSSGVNVVCSTALMLSRICCVLEAPISTVVTSSWCSSQARAISARV